MNDSKLKFTERLKIVENKIYMLTKVIKLASRTSALNNETNISEKEKVLMKNLLDSLE